MLEDHNTMSHRHHHRINSNSKDEEEQERWWNPIFGLWWLRYTSLTQPSTLQEKIVSWWLPHLCSWNKDAARVGELALLVLFYPHFLVVFVSLFRGGRWRNRWMDFPWSSFDSFNWVTRLRRNGSFNGDEVLKRFNCPFKGQYFPSSAETGNSYRERRNVKFIRAYTDSLFCSST